VMALLLLIFGPLAAIRMAVDIFPDIRVPVIGVAFQYAGLSPSEVANRLMGPYERILTTTVNDIEHTETTAMNGIGIVKIFFQPNRSEERRVGKECSCRCWTEHQED